MYTLPPRGKTTVDLFADFMRYLFDSTEALFKSSEPNGELRWASISKSIELVLTHPKGWERAILQTAAVEAGIVPDTPVGRACIYFVTEGEASLNFCATQTQAGKRLKVCRTMPAQSCFFNTRSPTKKFRSSMWGAEPSTSAPTWFSATSH